jgi:peptidyl-prolyl cis-trans isomerase A (cyclophilin A)
MRTILPLFVVLLVVAFVGCGGGGSPMTDAGPGTDAGSGTPAIFQVTFVTSAGTFVTESHRDWAPNGVDNFYALVSARFFDGNRFFRVVPGFITQWGISGDPAVTASLGHVRIPADPVVQHNARGFISYAMIGSDTGSRTTQLYVNLGDNTASLDPQGFAPIAQVITGMSVVDMIDAEYGQMPVQSSIETMGNAYLDASFPRLTSITSARVTATM